MQFIALYPRTANWTLVEDGSGNLQFQKNAAVKAQLSLNGFLNVLAAQTGVSGQNGIGVPFIIDASTATGNTAPATFLSDVTTIGTTSGILFASINVTAFTSGTITLTLTYTDDQSNVQNFVVGTATASGIKAFTPVAFRWKGGTTTTLATSGTFTATYNNVYILTATG